MKHILSIIIVFIFLSQITFAQDLRPTEKQALINVTVTNFKEKPRKGETIILENNKTKKTFSGISDANGKFSLLIPKGNTYNVKYKNFSDNVDYNKIEIPDQQGLITSTLTIKIQPPKTYTLKNVFFDTGKATLKKESYKALNDLVKVMELKNTLVIEIAGHTDNVGSYESNIKLSQDRANAVRNYLIKNNISNERTSSKGYGYTQPVSDNSTEKGRQQNRRTEVRIIKE
jgi:outer membrane protein OmpA-like peptidoglycan-associated protein